MGDDYDRSGGIDVGMRGYLDSVVDKWRGEWTNGWKNSFTVRRDGWNDGCKGR